MVYSPRLGGQIASVDPRNDATSKNILGFTKRLLQSCVLLQFLVNRPGGLPNVQWCNAIYFSFQFNYCIACNAILPVYQTIVFRVLEFLHYLKYVNW